MKCKIGKYLHDRPQVICLKTFSVAPPAPTQNAQAKHTNQKKLTHQGFGTPECDHLAPPNVGIQGGCTNYPPQRLALNIYSKKSGDKICRDQLSKPYAHTFLFCPHSYIFCMCNYFFAVTMQALILKIIGSKYHIHVTPTI